MRPRLPRRRAVRVLLSAVLLVGAVLVPASVSQAATVCPGTSPGGNPAISRNTDGRLELFLVRADGSIWHKWQEVAGGGWSGWHSLGSGFLCTIAVGRNADGRLEVFTLTNGGFMSHRYQTSPGGGWGAWEDLGGPFVATNIAVAANLDGRLQVFAVSSSIATPDRLFTKWQRTVGGWSTWADLGGPVSTAPAVGRNADGRLEVFAGYNDHAVYHAWQESANGTWSGWASLGSPVQNPRFAQPAVGLNEDGRMEIYVPAFPFLQGESELWHRYQTSSSGPSWGSWLNFGGATLLSVPSVASNADGRQEFFVIRSPDRAMWHKYQLAPNAGWSAWLDFGGAPFSSYPVSIRNPSGRLEVFAIGLNDLNVWHKWQLAANSGWSAWFSLGHP
jgi:hypothetical protein